MTFIVYSCCSCLSDIDPQTATCFSYANIYQDKAGLYLTKISGILRTGFNSKEDIVKSFCLSKDNLLSENQLELIRLVEVGIWIFNTQSKADQGETTQHNLIQSSGNYSSIFFIFVSPAGGLEIFEIFKFRICCCWNSFQVLESL